MKFTSLFISNTIDCTIDVAIAPAAASDVVVLGSADAAAIDGLERVHFVVDLDP